jgi:hypothetical protein
MADETSALALHPISIQPVRRTAPTAIWSLVLAIPSLFCGRLFTAIPAVFCGHMARAKIRKAGGALGAPPQD